MLQLIFNLLFTYYIKFHRRFNLCFFITLKCYIILRVTVDQCNLLFMYSIKFHSRFNLLFLYYIKVLYHIKCYIVQLI